MQGDNTLEVTAERDKDSTGSGDSGRGASEEGEGRGKLRPGEQPLSPSTMGKLHRSWLYLKDFTLPFDR